MHYSVICINGNLFIIETHLAKHLGCREGILVIHGCFLSDSYRFIIDYPFRLRNVPRTFKSRSLKVSGNWFVCREFVCTKLL